MDRDALDIAVNIAMQEIFPIQRQRPCLVPQGELGYFRNQYKSTSALIPPQRGLDDPKKHECGWKGDTAQKHLKEIDVPSAELTGL